MSFTPSGPSGKAAATARQTSSPRATGRSLQVADTLGARSVAFPAIATGIYGFPPDQAARIAVHTIRSTPTAVEYVRLVAFDQSARDILETALNA
jgi:O-acetyl-ADP-ribose deacetylase